MRVTPGAGVSGGPAQAAGRSPQKPVTQKRQPIAHPAWLDTHTVLRPRAGMSTASTSALSPSSVAWRNAPGGNGTSVPDSVTVTGSVVTLAEVLRTVLLDDETELHVLAGGRTPPDPARLLASGEMRELLQGLRATFEAVVIDAPPVNLVTDAAVLGTASDGVVMVVRSGTTSQDALRDAVQHLEAVGAPVLGVVLNDVDFRRERGYDGAYGSYRRGYASYG